LRWSHSTTATAVIVLVFLVTRLAFLDADLPDFRLSEFAPIDEFAYTVPAFNLLHYGTWTHQLAAWAPIEGWPMNVLQNIVAATTMAVGGYTYWGLRASSVLFALIGFLAIWRVVRATTTEALEDRVSSVGVALGVEAVAVALLLVDFGSIVGARGVEPTVSRFAAVGALLWATQRGWFLAPNVSLVRNGLFGFVVAVLVWFVYIYNLFLLPAAFIALLMCGLRPTAWRSVAGRAAAFVLGALVGTAVYFGAVAIVYGETPIDWYRVWVAGYGNSARVDGFSLPNLASLLDANSFRLDAPLLLAFLVGIPVFFWWTTRARRPWAILLLAMLAMFTLQSAAVADYPYKKFLILLIFATPIAATAVLRAGPFLTWMRAQRMRTAAGLIYLAIVLAVWTNHLLSTRIGGEPRITWLVQIGGAVFLAGAAFFLISPRFVRRALALVLVGAMLAPLGYADLRGIYRGRTYSYRNALIAAGAVVDDQVTAGDLSFGMQLYNTSRPVLEGYVYGLTNQEYLADVVRAFSEGRAKWLFAYTTPIGRSRWESRGFVLVETYAILLPHGAHLGRYEFRPTQLP
jgi:hypothetical protein